jgi:capsid protein
MQAAKLYRVNEKRRWMGGGGSSRLFDAGAPNNSDVKSKKRRFPRTDYDTSGNVSEWGWREIMSAARYLSANFGPIREGQTQISEYSVGDAYNVQYKGRNREWGLRMEEWLYEHDKACDVRGLPYDFRTGLILDLISIIRDGDCATLLVDGPDGLPMYQSIPAHRIGMVSNTEPVVKEGRYRGYRIINGVILDQYNRPTAYRVFNSMDADDYQDIPASAMFMEYRPEFYDQARGLSWLAPCIYDAADIMDLRALLKIALKAEASITLVEHNEVGAPQGLGSALVGGIVPGGENQQGNATPSVEYFDDSTVRYFRAGTGSKIEAPNSQRPSQNAREFSNDILRSAFAAMGWPLELHNPDAMRGANTRMRIAQAMRTIEQVQRIADRIAIRKHTFAIAKAIELGILPPDEDWYKIEHQKPRTLTVDNGRDTKADIELYKIGAKSLEELCAGNGRYWEEVVTQKVKEAAFISDQAAMAGVDPRAVQMLTPNEAPQAADVEDDSAEDEPADMEEPDSEDTDET